jgi:aspartate kinase
VKVLKFGGACLSEPESFLKIADLIIERTFAGCKIAVVVSAMGNTTDQLFQLASQVHKNPPRRELDMLVSAGERISIALLAMALAAKGVEAVSFTGSQSGIITTDNHANAMIVDIRPRRIVSVLDQGRIPIVAGFQGVSRKGEITTLGRGGSDTTAVALAAALRSPEVEFFKDVPGIFEADPKNDPNARHLAELSYKSALDLATRGAKVLHPRAISLAEKNGVKLTVRSFKKEGETVVGKEARLSDQILFETEGEP